MRYTKTEKSNCYFTGLDSTNCLRTSEKETSDADMTSRRRVSKQNKQVLCRLIRQTSWNENTSKIVSSQKLTNSSIFPLSPLVFMMSKKNCRFDSCTCGFCHCSKLESKFFPKVMQEKMRLKMKRLNYLNDKHTWPCTNENFTQTIL